MRLDYRHLIECLNAPPRVAVQPWDDQHPDWHRLPEDPFHTVTDDAAARATLVAWPLRQQVLAGLTAVEMVVPVWEFWARSPAWPGNTSAHPDDLRAAVREVRAWLREPGQFQPVDEPEITGALAMDLWVPEPPPTQALADTLYHAYEVGYSSSWVDPEPPLIPRAPVPPPVEGRLSMPHLRDIDAPTAEPDPPPAIPNRYDARAASRAAWAAWSLVDVLANALEGETGLTTFQAVQAALDALGDHLRLPPATVYARWWARVVCRMPLADAATCDFEVLDLQAAAPVA